MIFRQFLHDDLGCASYLVGDPATGVGALVDPGLDTERYLETAAYLGLRIEHVLETHTHADHVSGHHEIVAATRAVVHIHADAGVAYPHEKLVDGSAVTLGSVRLQAIHTPGHRPEHTAFALADLSRAEEPWAVLTGDSLFIGDVARPDLAVDGEDGARQMFWSLARLHALPDTTEVWPGHIGGSLCASLATSRKPSSTIGFERAHNSLFRERDEPAFVERSLEGLLPKPPNYQAIVQRNRDGARTAPAAMRPISADALAAMTEDVLLADLRSAEEFDDGHIPGSVPLELGRPGFGSRLGWMATPGRPTVFVGRDEADAPRASLLAATVGVAAAGHLEGGIASWRERGHPLEGMERLSIEELGARRSDDSELQILDVRELEEWRAGHIPGSIQRSYRELTELPAGIDRTRPIAVVCASGGRTALAAGRLRALGAEQVMRVAGGGVASWQRNGSPIVTDAPSPGHAGPDPA